MNKVYRSKVDTWLGALLIGMPVGLAFVIWKLIHAPVPGRWFIAIVTLLIGILLPISLLLWTRYRIGEQHLLVRSGIFSWKIPLNEISSIQPSRDPSSGPALSLDRLRIEYGQGKALMISPVNKEEFLNALKSLSVPNA